MESFSSNFKLVFELLAENQIISNKWRGVNIDQSAMYYLLIVSLSVHRFLKTQNYSEGVALSRTNVSNLDSHSLYLDTVMRVERSVLRILFFFLHLFFIGAMECPWLQFTCNKFG